MMKIYVLSMFSRCLVLSVSLLGVASTVSAADGQTVINQSKAQAGKVTPGDAAGFPVTLSRSGSYVLSSNLTVPADKTGILIAANDVTIDLNGFKIAASGPEGVSIGSGIGPDAFRSGRGVVIRNGTITNFAAGINLQFFHDTVVEEIRAYNNTEPGFALGPRSVVSGNVVSGNGTGIAVGSGSLVSGNHVSSNAGRGILVDCPSNIVGNTSVFNLGADISEFGAGCTRANNYPAP